MSSFHVCVMRGGWAITMLVREKDSRKKTEDIVYYIILIINFIFSSIRSSTYPIKQLHSCCSECSPTLNYESHILESSQMSQCADGPWPAPMSLRFSGKYGIDRVPQRLSTSRDGHKVSVNYNSLIKCALDALCQTHIETHTRNHTRREN